MSNVRDNNMSFQRRDHTQYIDSQTHKHQAQVCMKNATLKRANYSKNWSQTQTYT